MGRGGRCLESGTCGQVSGEWDVRDVGAGVWWDVGAGVWRVGRGGRCLESGTWEQVSGEWDVVAGVWRVGLGAGV